MEFTVSLTQVDNVNKHFNIQILSLELSLEETRSQMAACSLE
jgi:hypothetical protein